MKQITAIITFDSHRARYYMSELEKYVKRLTNGEVEVVCEFGGAPRDNALVLAHLDELSLDAHDLFDPVTEDIIDIDVKNGVGYIAGSNDRSILIGIYKYLNLRVADGCVRVRTANIFLTVICLTTPLNTEKKRTITSAVSV